MEKKVDSVYNRIYLPKIDCIFSTNSTFRDMYIKKEYEATILEIPKQRGVYFLYANLNGTYEFTKSTPSPVFNSRILIGKFIVSTEI